jgi:hypothetical protein
MSKLSVEQRATLLLAIQYRACRFPRGTLQAKLSAADSAYHMAHVRSEDNKNNQKDSYSRFAELDNALTREAVEAYAAYYIDTYVGKNKVFSMTSTKEHADLALKFNTILADQDKQARFKANLSRMLLDLAKYNLGAVEVDWVHKRIYGPQLSQQIGQEPDVQVDTWQYVLGLERANSRCA